MTDNDNEEFEEFEELDEDFDDEPEISPEQLAKEAEEAANAPMEAEVEMEAETEPDEDEEAKETEEEQAPAASATPVGASPVSADEIPITLAVEVAQLQTDVQTLLNLQPGNLLEFNATTDQAVSLVVNGSCVGKGELLKVGDAIGVRVLEVGHK